MIYILAFLVFLLLLTLSYAIYKSEENDIFKLICLPLLFATALALGFHYIESLGRPAIGEPVGQWNYIHHETDGVDIELWVKDKKGSRLYIFPYDEETQEQLEGANGLVEEGVEVIGNFNNSEHTHGDLEIKVDTRTIPK